MDDTSSHTVDKGIFLIACPDIDEGIFHRSVVLLCDHSAAGSFGLVVNKPLEKDVTGELSGLESFDASTLSFRAGGPMQPGQIMLLHRDAAIPNQTLEVCPGVYLGGDASFLQTHTAKEPDDAMLLCFGFAGWTAGLLEKEIASGMWYSCPAEEETIFSTDPNVLWQHLLTKMGGKYASIARIPEDLSQN